MKLIQLPASFEQRLLEEMKNPALETGKER
jgi:hypothetical protein